MPALADFKKHRKYKGYLVRDLGDNNTGFGEWVEVIREDGFGFGAMYASLADQVIEADKAKPAPGTGHKLEDIFAAPVVDEPAPAE